MSVGAEVRGSRSRTTKLLEADERVLESRLEVADDGLGSEVAVLDPVEADVDDAPHDLADLDVDTVRVQVSANGVERLLGLQAAVHRHEVVGHQQQANRWISQQAVDEGFSRHGLDGGHQVRHAGAVDRVDSLEQDGEVVADRGVLVRAEAGDRTIHLLEHVGVRRHRFRLHFPELRLRLRVADLRLSAGARIEHHVRIGPLTQRHHPGGVLPSR